jgi:hypothetical protein
MKPNGESGVGRCLARVMTIIMLASATALSGCYIFSPSQASENKLQTKLHFDVTQCQQTAPNLYKCPGVDKSICGAYYSGEQVDCLYVDKDGSVMVMKQ